MRKRSFVVQENQEVCAEIALDLGFGRVVKCSHMKLIKEGIADRGS